MKSLVLLIAMTGGLAAFSAQAQSGAVAPSAGTAAGSGSATGAQAGAGKMANDTPSAACKSMVESAKAKNFEAFMKLTTEMPMREKKNIKQTKGNFQKMQSNYLERLQDLNCGTETIAQDHAMVESESKGEKRLIPFVKTNEGWKFDMNTYQSFYDTEKHQMGKGKM